MNEAAWTAWVIDYARWHKWSVAHFRPACSEQGWRTAVQGDKGSPDPLLARDGVVILAELKTDTGRIAPEQRRWLDALGPRGAVWRPRDRPQVMATLGAPRSQTAATTVD